MARKTDTVWQWLAAFLPLAIAMFGIAVTCFPPPTDERKTVWIAVFGALGLAAIVSTRQAQIAGSRETSALKRAHENLLKSVGGDDGYCYFRIVRVADVIPTTLELVLLNEGDFPLYDMAFSIKRIAPPGSASEDALARSKNGPICSRDYGTVHAGAAEIGYSLPYEEGDYQIDISTLSGRICEIVRVVDRGNGELVPYVDVYRGNKADHVVKSEYWLDYANPKRVDCSYATQITHPVCPSQDVAVVGST